jgi:hypothetical protein
LSSHREADTNTQITALGNMVGGGLFVATIYWYLYLTGEIAVQIDFNLDPINTAMEVGGPMRGNRGHKESIGTDANTIIEGRDPHANASNGLHSTHSGGAWTSAFTKEFSDSSPYAKTHAERTQAKTASNENV